MLFLRIYSALFVAIMCLSAKTQSVRIGIVDVYGNSAISTETVRATAGVNEGDSISQRLLAERTIENSLEKVPGVKLAQTSVICCSSEGAYILFIGVAENDSSVLKFRKSPNLKIKLPGSYMSASEAFARRVDEAILAGEAEEDWSDGYSMIKYAPARRIQEKYLRWANSDFDGLKKVLRSSAFSHQRATAIQIIAYNDDKGKVIPELLYATRDEDEHVRTNAVRALSAISYYMTLQPGKGKVPFQAFARMLNSVVWSDRNRGLEMVMQLSESRNTELFQQLRASSLRSLKEMALWKSERHAVPAFVILARMAGWPDETIRSATSGGNFAEEAKNLVSATE